MGAEVTEQDGGINLRVPLSADLSKEIAVVLLKHASPLAQQTAADMMVRRACESGVLDELVAEAFIEQAGAIVAREIEKQEPQIKAKAVRMASEMCDKVVDEDFLKDLKLRITKEAVHKMNVDPMTLVGDRASALADQVYQDEMARRLGPIMDDMFVRYRGKIQAAAEQHVMNQLEGMTSH